MKMHSVHKSHCSHLYRRFQGRFHTELDDEYIFIGLKNDNGIFKKSFLEKVDSLSKFIGSLDHILSVYSITQTGYVYVEKGKLIEAPLIHISAPERYKKDSINLFQSREYLSLMVSDDGQVKQGDPLNL